MSESTARPGSATDPGSRNRTLILTLILAVQLMIAIDITVMNMALPRIQQDLGFSPAGLSWVLNAYTLAYGGLLLLGGRMGDILGHRKALVIGVALFTAASLLGGLAQSSWWLLAARAVQGIGGALAAPSTLAIVVTTFREESARNRALGIFVMASGLGTAGGLLLGGLLTDAASWRWVLLINVPFGLVVALLAPRFIPASQVQRGRFDVGGALTATLGTTAVVYGFVNAAERGWSEALTITAFAVGVLLLAVFVAIEARHRQPILKLGLFAHRDRSGGFLVFICSGAAMFGMFFLLTQFVQEVLALSPFGAGLAFLPMAVLMFIVPAQVTPRLVTAVGAKPTMLTGLAMITAGMAWLTAVSAGSSYAGAILGPMLLFGAGVGLLNPPLTGTILASVPPQDSGAASGVLQAVGMIGGSVGTAILVTIFGTSIRNATPPPGLDEATRASTVLADAVAAACVGGALFAAAGFLLVLLVIRSTKRTAPAGDPAPATS
ncbi:MFS transporter [Saccharothrix syringae]|uniref:MFS transporter n=1 Tax=Saccharothrix syringae TaxID=103733 RepID=A0A5Q0H1L7_SACSY|nr:MFS transporter [Saccharothrix syringae]QFZ20141.1 MFS transporter [Saccharothrix syringae]